MDCLSRPASHRRTRRLEDRTPQSCDAFMRSSSSAWTRLFTFRNSQRDRASARSLNTCWYEHLGTGPKHYVLLRRMHRVRRAKREHTLRRRLRPKSPRGTASGNSVVSPSNTRHSSVKRHPLRLRARCRRVERDAGAVNTFASQAAGLAYLAARGRRLPGSRSHPVVYRRKAGRGNSPSHVYRQPGLAARCLLARP